jgi:hypothetical protein
MPAAENLITSDQVAAKSELTDAQVKALDLDGDGKAGGSKPKAGEVLKKGAAPPEVVANRKAGDIVIVRITKTGNGQVHTGSDDPNQPKHYVWQDEVALPLGIAQALEVRSFAEIIG